MKVRLKTLSIEVDKDVNIGITYKLKINEIPVGKAEPYILWQGNQNSPEIVKKEIYIYPILGLLDIFPYLNAQPIIYVDKENNDSKSLRVAVDFAGLPLTVKLARLTLNNPTDNSILIHSISYPPKILGISLNYPDQTGEIFNPDVPNFFLFLRQGNFVGDVLGAHELYTYEIPPKKMIQINLFYEASDGQKIHHYPASLPFYGV